MNSQQLTKLQDQILNLQSDARECVIRLIEILAETRSVPKGENCFDMVKEVKALGFQEDTLDTFKQEETKPLILKTSKEEQDDINEFNKQIESISTSKVAVKSSKKIKTKLPETKETKFFEKLNLTKDFMEKYGYDKTKEISIEIYNEVEKTYSKKLPWAKIDNQAKELGYDKENYKPKIRLAFVIAHDKGYL